MKGVLRIAHHYHRCPNCGGFFECHADAADDCEQNIRNAVRNDCGLGIRELAFEARHSARVINIMEEAALLG